MPPRPAILASRINAPTTRPPPLSLPTKSTSQSRPRYLLAIGRAYLVFYKTGFKQILANRHRSKQVKLLLSTDPTVRSLPGDAIDHTTGRFVTPPKPPPAEASTELTRAEYQLLRRHSRDLRKLAPFAVLLAVFGEWLPLFVKFLTPILPGTVLLPGQVESRRRRRASVTAPSLVTPTGSGRTRTDRTAVSFTDDEKRNIATRLGLTFRLTSSIVPMSVLDRRLNHHRDYLAQDDRLLRQHWLDSNHRTTDDSKDELDDAEVDIALEERGLWEADQSIQVRRKLLQDWLERTREDDDDT